MKSSPPSPVSLLSVVFACIAVSSLPPTVDAAVTTWIKRDGDRLYNDLNANGARDTGELYKQVGVNFPTAMMTNDKGYPSLLTDVEYVDAIDAWSQMGVDLVRIYVFPIGAPAGNSAYVTGIGAYDENNFRRLDRFLQLCEDAGIRVIIPFIDQHSFIGGITEFAGFRGKTANQFFTDATVKQDFKNFITDVLNRTNFYTGVKYKNNKTIMAWQPGNELDINSGYSTAWEIEMCSHISSLTVQLTMSSRGQASTPDTALLDAGNVDILQLHPYSYFNKPLIAYTDNFIAACAGKKPFIVDEYDDVNTANIQNILNKCDNAANPHYAGALIWGYRSHAEAGGVYKRGPNPWKTFTWPGSTAGENDHGEITKMSYVRTYAYQVRGQTVPTVPALADAPYLFPDACKDSVDFRGVAGAETYEIQRGTSPTGPWTTVAPNYVSVGQVFARGQVFIAYSTFADTNAPAGTVHYRVRGKNKAGVAGPWSNVVGCNDSSYAAIDNSRGLTYTGTWIDADDPDFKRRTKSTTSTSGSSVQRTFTGTAAAIFTKKGPQQGQFDVYVDGVFQTTVDTYAPADSYQVKVYEKTGLSSGSHTIRLQHNGQRNPNSTGFFVAFDYFGTR